MFGIFDEFQATANPVVQAAPATPAPPFFYLKPAPLADVLYDQMDFLIAHAGHDEPGCSDCERLAQVVSALMRPFV